MLASSAPAAACTGLHLVRRTDPLVGAAMGLMLLGMADTMLLGARVLPAPVWGLLPGAAGGGLLAHRSRRAADAVLHLAARVALVVLPALAGHGGHEAADLHGSHGMSTAPAGWLLMAVLGVALVHTGRAWLQLLRHRTSRRAWRPASPRCRCWPWPPWPPPEPGSRPCRQLTGPGPPRGGPGPGRRRAVSR